MAENEMLDVGNRRRYSRFCAEVSGGAAPSQIADALQQDALEALRKCLRGNPIYLVLRACDAGAEIKRAAVESLKNKSLARMVADAHRLSATSDPATVALTMVERHIDRLVDRAVLYVLRQDSQDRSRAAQVEFETRARLQGCKVEMARNCEAALRDISLPPTPTSPKRATAQSVVATSLMAK